MHSIQNITNHSRHSIDGHSDVWTNYAKKRPRHHLPQRQQNNCQLISKISLSANGAELENFPMVKRSKPTSASPPILIING